MIENKDAKKACAGLNKGLEGRLGFVLRKICSIQL